MKPSDTIKAPDKEHVVVNGALIDIPKLRHWFESNSWPHHSPAHAFYKMVGYGILLVGEPDYLDHDAEKAFDFFLNLAILAGYGFYIPDKVFSIVPKHSPWFRDTSCHGHHGIFWSGFVGNEIGENPVLTEGYFDYSKGDGE